MKKMLQFVHTTTLGPGMSVGIFLALMVISAVSGFAQAPIISSLTPATTTATTTALPIMLQGSNLAFSELTISQLDANGTPVGTLDLVPVVSSFVPSQINITLPAFSLATVGNYTITLTGPGGVATTTLSVTLPPPTLTSFAPTAAMFGTTVVINGTNFGSQGNITAVQFGGVAALYYRVVSNTKIIAGVPSGAVAGDVTVVGNNGTIALGGFSVNVPSATAIPTLYWTNGTDNALASSNLTAKTSNTSFVAAAARYVHFSYEDNALFWSVADGATVRIRRAQADGSNVNNDFIITSGDVQGVTSGEGYIFWVRSGGSIARANIDGSNIDENFVAGIGTARAIHSYNGDIYWSETGSGSSLKKVSVNGGTPSTLIANMQDDNVAHFAIDRTTGQIFWTGNSASGGVWRANSDGSGITKIYDQNNTLNGIALLGGYVYWINFFDQRIERVRYDGTGLETNFLAIGKNGGSLAANGLRFGSLPGVSTFTPTTVAINGAGTAITITGTNFQYVTDVRFGNVAAQSFSVNSATEISAVVGTGASGRVEVATLTGVGGATGFIFSTVTTASVSPTSAAEGQNVTINGTNLDGVTEVRFFGPSGERAEIISKTPTQIVVEVPAGITESGGQIYLSGSTGFTSTPTFSLVQRPVITSVTPTLVGIDDTVRISGRNLSGVTQVRFFGGDGTLVAGGSILSNTANEIVVLVPNRPAGAGNVWVGSPAGSATSPVQTTITLDPAITYVNPYFCLDGPWDAPCLPNTDRVTIYGRNLNGVIRIRQKNDAGAEQTIISKTNTRIIVQVGGTFSSSNYFSDEEHENQRRLFLEHPLSDMTTVPLFQTSSADSAAVDSMARAYIPGGLVYPVQRISSGGGSSTLYLQGVDGVQATGGFLAQMNSVIVVSLDTANIGFQNYSGFQGYVDLNNSAFGSTTLTIKVSLYDMNTATFANVLSFATLTPPLSGIQFAVRNTWSGERATIDRGQWASQDFFEINNNINSNGGRRIMRISIMEKKSLMDTIVGYKACATCGSAGGGGRAFNNVEIMYHTGYSGMALLRSDATFRSRNGAHLVTRGGNITFTALNLGGIIPRLGFANGSEVLTRGFTSAMMTRTFSNNDRFGVFSGHTLFPYVATFVPTTHVHRLVVDSVLSDSTIRITIPNDAVRNRLPLDDWEFYSETGGPVLITSNAPFHLEVVDAPTITSVGGGNIGSDSKVYTATGATLQINGTNLDNITHVRFFSNDGTTATVLSSTATQLIVRVPGNPSSAEGNIRITNIAGSVNSGQTIVVAQAPVITSVSGASVLADGTYLAMTGATLTVHGNNFNSISEVKFFGRTGVNAAITSKTNTQIVLTVPNNIAKFGGKIFMENIGGVAVSPEYFITFPPPTITAVSGFAVAESGNVLTAAGQTITVTGQNLDRDNTFRFFGASGTVAQVQSSSATQAVVLVPSGITGTSGKVYVSNIAGTSQSPETVELMQPPALAGISPVQVWPANNHNLVTPGSTVTLTGTSLRFLTAVKMYGESGNNVTIQSSTATQVVITIPATASATSGQIYVQNIAGNAPTPQTVEIVAPPTITSITPTQTWSNGRLLTTTGQTITLHGTNLQYLNNVRFFGNSGVGATVLSSSATQAVVRVPVGITVASGQIYATNMAGNTLSPEIEIVAPPVISGVVGTQVWTNGNVLTSTGQSITIAGNNLQYVNFHRMFGTTGTVVSVHSSNANAITLTVPAGLPARLGNYHVSNIAGSTASVQIIEIIGPPVVTGLTVTQVWGANNRYLTTTGHSVKVHGSDLQYINEHRFFGTTGTLVTVESSSATQIELTVPAGLPAPIGNIFVKNIAGSTISSQVVEIVAPPQIYVVSPLFIQRGAYLTVTGAHLQYLNEGRYFGSNGAYAGLSSSATLVTALTPSNALSEGHFWVQNIAGSTQSSQLIRVVDYPVLLSVEPSRTHTGGTVVLTGFNLQFLTDIRFWGSGGIQAEVISSSATRTEVRTPAGVSSAIGRIWVRNISGLSDAPWAIEIVSPPVIHSVSTTLTTTGQTLTITGNHLQYIDAIRFFSSTGTLAEVIGTSTATQLQITVPAGITATSGHIYMQNIGGFTESSERVEIVAPAIINQMSASNSPFGGPYSDGTTVLTVTGGTLTISGTNLLHLTGAKFFGSSGVEGSIVSKTRTQAVVTVPPGIGSSSGKLTFVNMAGERSSGQDIVVLQSPTISTISPFVTTTGLSISVHGTQLQYVNSLRFGGQSGIESGVSSSTATQLTTLVPSGIGSRFVRLFVQNPAGQIVSTQEVEIISAPQITGVSSLITGTGATVTLFGKELQYITSVKFFGATGVPAIVLSSSATQLTIQVPSGVTVVSGQIYVENIAGNTLTPQVIEIAAPPRITGISPLLAPLGATVTISGERLNYLSSVKFFGNSGVSAIVQSSSASQAVVTVPSGITVTSGQIYIENTAGFALSEQLMEVILPPIISSVSTLRTTTGQSISLTGEHLNRITAVRFFGNSGVGGIVLSSSATQLTVNIPEGIAHKTGRIYVENVVGSAQTAENITIIYAPIISTITPSVSTTGLSISLTGENLEDLQNIRIGGIGGVSAIVSSSNAHQATVIVPTGVATRLAQVYCENIAGNSLSSGFIEIVGTPVITHISPLIARFGDTLTLSGEHLGHLTQIRMFGNSGLATSLVPGASFTQARIIVPAGIVESSGKVYAENIAGNVLSGQTVELLRNPEISTISKTITTTGQTLTLTGNNLQFITEVRFFGSSGVSATVLSSSATHLVVTVPSGIVAESGTLYVANSVGSVHSPVVTIVRPPQITAVTPNTSRRGYVIVLNGTNLHYIDEVRFFGATGEAAEILSSSATQLSVKVPSNITSTGGNIYVANMAGNALSPETIIQLPLPLLVYWSNNTGIAAGDINTPSNVNHSFIPVTGGASGIFVDVNNGFIYWAEATGNRIGRANLDGSVVNSNFITGLGTPRNVIVNSLDGYVYWINGSSNSIGRTTLAQPQQNINTQFITGLSNPISMVQSGGTLYIADAQGNNIRSASVAGGVASSFMGAAQVGFNPRGVIIDGGYIYWVTPNEGVRRRLISGGTVETIVPATQLGGSAIVGITVFDGKVYWTESSAGIVRRANTNGGQVETMFSNAATATYPHIGRDVTASPPAISSFTPTSMWAGGTVTITGSGFKNQAHVLAVRFGGVEAQYQVISDTEIRATVGAGNSGSVQVQTLGGGASADGFSFIGAPTITSLSTTEGAAGTTVIINGANLQYVNQVRFFGTSGIAGTITGQSASQLSIVVPSGITGSGSIMVIGSNGSASAGQNYRIIGAPVISGISPIKGVTGGTVVLQGTELDRLTSVRFFGTSGVTGTVVSSSPHQATITIPAGIQQPEGAIVAQTIGGTTQATQSFRLVQPPIISSVSTTQTIVGGTIGVSGLFEDITSVRIFGNNGMNAQFTQPSSSQLEIVIPSGVAGQSGSIVIANAAGSVASTTIEILAPPVVQSITPSLAKEGDTLRITGTHLASVTQVRYFGSSGIGGTIVQRSATELRVIVPFGTAGQSGSLVVVNPAGSLSTSQEVQIIAPPVVSNVSPTFVSVGATITLTGQHLAHLRAVKMFGANGISVPIISSNATQVIVSVPVTLAGQSGQLYCENIAGGTLATQTIQVAEPLSISSITPQITTTGASIELRGTGLNTLVAVRFFGTHGMTGTIQSSTATVASVIVPSGITTRFGQVYAENPGSGVLFSSPLEIVYPPVISSVSSLQTASGATLTISGSELQHVSVVKFFGSNGNNVGLAIIQSKTASQLVVTVPSNASSRSGQIYCENIAGSALSVQTVEIVNMPVISNISSVLTTSGATLTISGSELQHVSVVKFFGSNGASAVIQTKTANQLVVTVPNNASSRSGQIYCENIAGSTLSAQTVEIVNAPVISNISSVLTTSGATLTISGSELQHVNMVKFFGSNGASAVIQTKTANQLVVTVPNNSSSRSGQVYVENIAGSALSAQTVEIVRAPMVTDVSTTLTIRGATLTISGSELQHVNIIKFFGNTGASAVIQSKTASQLVVTVPANVNSSVGQIYCENIAGNTLSAQTVEIVNAPVIANISSLLTTSGATLTISGSELQHVSVVKFFGNTGALGIIQTKTASQLVVSVPNNASSRSGQLYVENQAGNTVSAQTVEIVNAPVINNVSSLLTTSGATLTISGSELQHVSIVKFFGSAGTTAIIQSKTANQIIVTVPQNASSRSGQLYVENQAGNTVSAQTVEIVNAPVISNVSSLLTTSGATLTISGSELQHVSIVKFFGSTGNNVGLAVLQSKTANQLVVTVPNNASSRSGQIYCENIAGSILSAQTVEIVNAPVISNVSSLLTTSGATLTISGSELQHVSVVRFFGNTGAIGTIQTKTAHQIIVTVPQNASSRSGQLYVENQAGNTVSAQTVEIVNAPVIANISNLLTTSGATLTISGSELQHVSIVKFFGSNGATAVLQSKTAHQIIVTVPQNVSSRSGQIYCENQAGNTVSAQTVEIVNAPIISNVSSLLTTSGATLTISGSELQHVSVVKFFGNNGALGTIQTKAAHQIIVTVPNNASSRSGQIYCENIAGNTLSTQAVEIVNAPIITSVSTTLTVSGATLTISGSELQHVSVVKFFGNNGVPAVLQSKTAHQLVVTVPFNIAALQGQLYCENIAGGVLSSQQVAIVSAPVITSVEPLDVQPGSTVLMLGRNLQHITTVRMFGASGIGAEIVSRSYSMLSVKMPVTPSASLGVVYCENMAGSAQSADTVRIVPAPLYMYWSKQQAPFTIGRMPMNNSNVIDSNFLPLAAMPGALAVDILNGYVYWNNGGTSIGRVNLDGTGFVPNYIGNISTVTSIALDVQQGQLYWGTGNGTIQRVSLATPANVQNVATGMGNISSISLSQTDVFTADATANVIRRVAKTGGTPAVAVQTATTGLGLQHILVEGSTLYWYSSSGLRRSTLTGANATTLAGATQFAQTTVTGLTFHGGRIYWSESTQGRIRRIASNGGTPEVFATNIPSPNFVSIGQNPSAIAPQIVSFTPISQWQSGEVLISGSGFINQNNVYSVQFGGVEAFSYNVLSDSTIRAVVAGGNSGSVEVQTIAGSAQRAGFTFIAAPQITSVSASRTITGATITLSGTNLQYATQARFFGESGIGSTPVNITPTSLQLVVPQGVTQSIGQITVVGSNGIGQSPQVEIIAPPMINSVSTTLTRAGATITLSGANLQYVTAVRFFGNSGVGAQVLSSSTTALTVVVPGGLGASSGTIYCANMAGFAETAQHIEIAVAPVLSSVNELLRTTGESITLIGTHLQYVTSVRLFGSSGVAAPFTIVSPTQLQVSIPSGITQREGRIWVENFVGSTVSTQQVRVVQAPIITALTPTSGLPGSILTLTGDDFERVDEVRFFGASGVLGGIVSKTRTSMQVSVPFGVAQVRGRIWVRNSVGSGLAPVDFSQIVLPSISDIQPRRVPEGGSITLYGSELADVQVVRFFGQSGNPGTIGQKTRDSIRVTVPVGISADAGLVHITNVAGSTSATHVLTIIRPPAIDSVVPMANIAGGSVTLHGRNFTDVSEVRFFGATGPIAQIVGRTATRLDVVIPMNPSGESGRIRVVNPAGFAETSENFRIILAPSISGITPELVATGGTITINGTRLSDVTEVRFFGVNGVLGTILSSSATQLTVRVPSAIAVAQGRVWIRNLAGSSLAPSDITLMPLPRILSVAPLSGVAGGTVTILGEQLQHVESVRFFGIEGVAGTIITKTANLLRVTIPTDASAEEGFLAAVAPSGAAVSTQLFRVILPPSISGFTPQRVQTGGLLTIQGARLGNVSEVRLFDSTGTIATIVSQSSNSILIQVPTALAADSGKIWLRNSAGIARSGQNVVIIRPPQFSSFSPVVAPVGDTIIISGNHLADVDTVRFFAENGVIAQITQRTATQLRVRVPSGATSIQGRIWLKNAAGSSLAPETFRIMQPPTVTQISPARSITGATITLVGTHLQEVQQVRFFGNAGVIATISRRAQDTIVVIAPPQVSGSNAEGNLFLRNNAGEHTTNLTFKYIAAPKIRSIAPLKAASGATITLSGEFDAISSVRFFALNGVTAPIISSSATQLQVQVPFGLSDTTGRIYAVNAAGNAVSSDFFTIERPTAPGAPQGLGWENITDFSMEAVWQPSFTGSPAQYFDVEVYRVGLGGSEAVFFSGRTEAPVFRLQVPNLEQGASYQFRVRGQNSVGISPWSFSPTGVTPDNRPLQPRFSSVRNIGMNEATIGWTNLSGGGVAAIFKVEVFPNGTPQTGTPVLTATTPAPADSLRLIGLTDDTDYYYRLRAENQFGVSLWEVGTTFTTERNMRRADSLALVALYNALGGNSWQRKNNWLGTAPLEQWHGITMEQGRVVAIVLPSNNLSGSLPSTIGNRELQKLRRLILWGNNISGGVPASLGLWRELVTVELDHNNFSAVNADMSQLAQLLALRLDVNNISAFPESILQIQNSPLQIFRLDRNSVSTLPARIDNFSQLRGLWLNNNQITGSIGGNFIIRMPLLQSVFLNGNRLTDVPTLTTIAPLRQVFIQNNLISSEALGRNAALIGRNEVNFVGLPQNTLMKRVITAYPGDNISLEPSDPDIAFGYRWFYNDSLIATISPESKGVHWILNVGGEFSLNEGNYRCEMYSPAHPDFSYVSDMVEIVTIGNKADEQEKPITGITTEPRVYPNPAADRITLEYIATSAEAVDVELWNNAGKKVILTVLYPPAPGVQTALLNVSDLPSGSYIIHLRMASGSHKIQIVIIR